MKRLTKIRQEIGNEVTHELHYMHGAWLPLCCVNKTQLTLVHPRVTVTCPVCKMKKAVDPYGVVHTLPRVNIMVKKSSRENFGLKRMDVHGVIHYMCDFPVWLAICGEDLHLQKTGIRWEHAKNIWDDDGEDNPGQDAPLTCMRCIAGST